MSLAVRILCAGALIAAIGALAPLVGAASASSTLHRVPAQGAATVRPGAKDAAPRTGIQRGAVGRRFAPRELLVRFRRGAAKRALGVGPSMDGVRVEARLSPPGLRLLRLPAGTSVHSAARKLERTPGVEYAEPNFYRSLRAVPNDPRFGEQWSLQNTGQPILGYAGTPGADISAPAAWETTTGSSAVTVAVIDDGIDYAHPDLAGQIWHNPGETGGGKATNNADDDNNQYVDDWRGWDFTSGIPGDNNPYPGGIDGSHGTNVAGVIGASANNGAGIAGVDWNARLMPLRIFDASDNTTIAEIVAAYHYAAQNGARIVNASFGGPGSSQAEHDAIQAASNVLFVVAAADDGRSSDTHPDYPCDYGDLANIICVAATDQDGRLADFSNFGPTNVDLGAPGERILSTYPPGKISYDLYEDFETSTAGSWTTGGRRNQWGLTNLLVNGDGSPNVSAADSPHGKYRRRTNSWVRTPALDFRDRKLCEVDFYLYLRTQRAHDYLYVESSSDGHAWTRLRSFTGSRNGYTYALLPKSVDGDPSAYVRWRLKSDRRVNADGAYLDDAQVTCETTAATYGWNDGTSFAAPEVSGTAALVWANSPSDTVAQVRSAILGGADTVPALVGKVANGRRLNAAAALGP